MSVPPSPEAPYPAGVSPSSPTPAAQDTNVLAVLSLVFAFLCAPVGIVLAVVARKQIRARGQAGAGLAKAGLILSVAVTVLAAISGAVSVALLGYSLSQLDTASPATEAATVAAMKSDAKAMATMQEKYITEHPSEPGFEVQPTDWTESVSIGGLDYQPTEGNVVTVTTTASQDGAPGGYCVLVTSLDLPEDPVMYDSAVHDFVGFDSQTPGAPCSAPVGEAEVPTP